ncbi:metallophosphoesterase family protein [Azospirillum soli]|uniref:metallophosphoesterase family protein n=1 Tax=Azospirillum soli TaxID=1304799 RepID=UPI001FE92BB1|nr:metallophosphoesterase family protein [Azospirillum soli]MBP2316405.1 serine/threonine protein phosphatase 1 [Azospirillum soli]
MVVYAVGDVHGELALLERLLDCIAEDRAVNAAGLDAVLVFLGDYVDRGPDSRGVMDRIAAGVTSDCLVRCLLGNHEQAMLRFLDDPSNAGQWLAFGGLSTLVSYGVEDIADAGNPVHHPRLRDELMQRLPPAHLECLRRLEPWAVYGDYGFVHAGIKPGRPIAGQSLDDLLWIRKPFLDSRAQFEKVIVHGHTIVPTPQILNNRIAVDTGAYATGVLSAVALQADRVRVLQATRR